MGRGYTKRQFNCILFIFIVSTLVIIIYNILIFLGSLPPYKWPIAVLIITCLIVWRRKKSIQRQRVDLKRNRLELKRLGNLNDLQKMNPIAFEHYIRDMFRQLDYDAHLTKATGDGGKDILLYKEDFHAIVECKRYVKSKVSRPDIQKFHSAIIDCKADIGYFITTGLFTAQAASYILDKPIVIIDGINLVKLVEQITLKSGSSEIEKILKKS